MIGREVWIFVGCLAAAVGAWWAFGAREASAAPAPSTFPPLIPPPAGAYLDPWASYAAAVGQQAAATGVYPQSPPIPPTGSGMKGAAITGAGYVGAAVASAACVSAGGGPLCALAAPIGKASGQLATAGVVYVGGKAVNATTAGAKAVGSAVANVASKLKFW